MGAAGAYKSLIEVLPMRNRLNWGSLEPPEFGCVGLRFRQISLQIKHLGAFFVSTHQFTRHQVFSCGA